MSGKYFAVGTCGWIDFVIASVFPRAVGVDVLLYYQSALEQSQLLLGVLPVAASVQHFFVVAFVPVPVLVLAPVEPAVLFVALAAEVVVVAFVGLFVDAVAAELAVELDAVELAAAAAELVVVAAELELVVAANASGVVASFAVVVAFDYSQAKVHY